MSANSWRSTASEIAWRSSSRCSHAARGSPRERARLQVEPEGVGVVADAEVEQLDASLRRPRASAARTPPAASRSSSCRSAPDSRRSSSAFCSGTISTISRSRYGSARAVRRLAEVARVAREDQPLAGACTRSARTGRGRRSPTAASTGPTPSRTCRLLSAASSLCRGRIGRLSRMRRPGANGTGNVDDDGLADRRRPPRASCRRPAASRPARCRLPSYAASNENTTSSAVNGWPSENVDVRAQLQGVHEAAGVRASSFRPATARPPGDLVDANQLGLREDGDEIGRGLARR